MPCENCGGTGYVERGPDCSECDSWDSSLIVGDPGYVSPGACRKLAGGLPCDAAPIRETCPSCGSGG